MRLTHTHCANLDYLNAYLFHDINFHAIPEGIDRLKAHPLSLRHGAVYDIDGCRNWRVVLDAIRNHSSLLQMRLEVACNISDERFLVAALGTFTRKPDQTKRAFQVGSGDSWDLKFELEEECNNLCRWIELRECEWDSRLDHFFPLRA